MIEAYLGIDTSCYTTSVAVAYSDGRYDNLRVRVPVKEGMVGIRQQDAVFFHIKTLPELIEKAFVNIRQNGAALKAVGCSTAPTTLEGSYMPVFVPGTSVGACCACAAGVPLREYSHQQGHIRAAQGDCELPDKFVALHMSGGTTDVLLVHKNGFDIDRLGGTTDISAGQVVDRVGVALGVDFPSGPNLENVAKAYSGSPIELTARSMGTQCSFSGIESAAQRMISSGVDKGALAMGLFYSIGKIISGMLLACTEKAGVDTVLLSGGVCSNSIIREIITDYLKDYSVLSGAPELCTDNAVGIARLTMEETCCEK